MSKIKAANYVRKRRIVKDIRDFKSTTDVVSNMGFKNEIKVSVIIECMDSIPYALFLYLISGKM